VHVHFRQLCKLGKEFKEIMRTLMHKKAAHVYQQQLFVACPCMYTSGSFRRKKKV
jgi:hypothetical protein